MANITYDILWREGMMELLDQLEAENPEDPTLAPKDLSEWACIYIRYIQILRKLETAYDQMVHPQKRFDMKKALEACIGRILEIRHWMVKLNRGLDYINLDDILVDLKLTPDVLETPIPKYFTEDRAKELDDRDKFLEALVEKYSVAKSAGPAVVESLPPLPVDDAIAMIQSNERGRQAREKAALMVIIKKQRQLADKRSKLGIALSQEEAATRIQAAIRGFINRRQIKREADNELIFIGMRPKARDAKRDPTLLEARNLVRRKRIQLEHVREYDEAVVKLKLKVKEVEGQDMRETIQDKINSWFVENRNPTSGDYPDFPEEDEGGSKPILNPPPPDVTALLAEDTANDKKKAPAGKGSKDAKGGKEAKGGKGDKKGKDGADEDAKEETISSMFIPGIEAAVQEYVAKWQDRDESTNFFQKFDGELVKDELRPIVFDEIRLKVDEEMRVLLQNLKDMVEAEKAAKTGKKPKKKKNKKKKGKKGKKDKAGKKKKDPTADRSMESLFAELVSNGILQQCPKVNVQDYLGSYSYMAATLEKANIIPDPSMGHIRQTVAEYCILPLGSAVVHEKSPFVKTSLFYGLEKTGKTLLTQAIAHQTGATFFNLSPRNTDGRYPGKNVSMMIHMIFKVARTMAPSVVYIDECEKVFLTDKKKLKEYNSQEPFNRIKKELLKEVKTLKAGERVLIVGNSKEPWLCAKKDEKAFIGFWNKFVNCPMPDYASRRCIWPGLIERYGGKLNFEFDLSTLAHITDSYTSGHIDMVVRGLLTKRRIERLRYLPVTIPEVSTWLCRVPTISKEQDDIMRKWTDKTPAMVALKGSAKASTAEKKDKEKGGKKKK